MKSVLSMLLSLILSISALLGIPVSGGSDDKLQDNVYSGDEIVSVIVELKDENLLENVTSANERKSVLKNFYNSEKYANLVSAQEKVKSLISKKFSVANFVNSYSYTFALNGFSLTIPYKYIEKLEKLSAVKSVSLSGAYEQPQAVKENTSEVNMADAAEFTGVPEIQNSGYTGKGMVVAVLDTGFDLSHEAFDFDVESPRLSKTDINVLTTFKSLNTIVPRWGANYYSSKIPYKWDYANVDKTVDNKYNFHGTHVAGIVGGKGKTPMYEGGPTLTGVAPDAQLLLMKVFGDKQGSLAQSHVILAALDDAVKLGADVINMSLGSPSGQDEEDIFTKDVYKRLQKSGIDVICSAGNEASLGKNDATEGSTTVNADLIDYGTCGSPSSFASAMSVASSAINEKISTYSQAVNVNEKGSLEISNFSSWGTTADMKLKPEITAPGSHVYSSVPKDETDGHMYEAWYGTSMASPYFAGSVALVKQYLSEKNPAVLKKNASENINSILMSTATVFRGYGQPAVYSPRRQGAGFVNLTAATSTKAYLTDTSGNRPKIELGDNNDGTLKLKFNVVNMSNEALTYALSVAPLIDSFEKQGDIYINTLTSKEVPKKDYEISYEEGVNEKGNVEVPANGKTTVSLTVKIDDNLLKQQQQAFKNGFFIDGFVYLKAENEPELSLPFMAFYGSWSSDLFYDYTMYDNTPSYLGKQWGLMVTDGTSYYPLGVNIFEEKYEKQYGIDQKYCFYSKNALKSKLKNPYVVSSVGLLRNGYRMDFNLFSDKGIFRYCGSTLTDYCRKTIDPGKPHIGKLWGGGGLIDGGGYVYKVSCKPQNYEAKTQTLSFTFTVDNKAAKIESAVYKQKSKSNVLSLVLSDNNYVMGYEVLTSDGVSLGKVSLKDKGEDGKYESTFEITKQMKAEYSASQLKQLQVYVLDYAYNETTAKVTLESSSIQLAEKIEAIRDIKAYDFVPAEPIIEIQ